MLWRACVSHYQQPREGYLGSPNDWTLDVPAQLMGCCEDCRQLAAFLANPKAVTETYRVITHRRHHIEQAVRR